MADDKYVISVLFKLFDRLSGPARKIRTGLDRLRKHLERVGKAMRRIGTRMTIGLTTALAGLGLMAVKKAADMETLNIQFEVMLGSAKEAQKVMKRLIDFTARTPFQLQGVANATRILLAFGFQSKKLMPTMKMLGDVAGGTGKDFGELALIYGQIRAAGRLMGQDYLQLAAIGINLQEMFQEQFGAAFDFRKQMERGNISFKMVEAMFNKMTMAGGRYHGMTERLSQSTHGLFSTLKDNLIFALIELGEQIIKVTDLLNLMRGAIVWAQGATKWLKEIGKTSPKLVKLALVIAGIVAILGPLLVMAGFAAIALGAIGTTTLIVIGAVTALGLAVAGLVIYWKDLVRWVDRFIAQVRMNFGLIGRMLHRYIIQPLVDATRWVIALIDVFDKMGKMSPKERTEKILRGSDPGTMLDLPGGAGFADPSSIEKQISESEVRIKIVTDPGATATVESMQSKGRTRVKVDSESYVGIAEGMGD